MSTADLIKQAKAFLAEKEYEKAIDTLRTDASNEDKDLIALIAHCYYERGDSKGDVHSSAYFAGRAIDLGHKTTDMYAIKAIGEFRKEKYDLAAKTFAEFITKNTHYATKFLYGLALFYNHQFDNAVIWLSQAVAENSTEDYQTALKEAKLAAAGKLDELPPRSLEKLQGLGGLYNKRPSGVDTPYKENALSKLAGIADTKKDFHWLKQSIPCQSACPAHTDIPGYLSEVYKGNFRKAYEINLRDNVFPGVLGRVCARPCESMCRHGWEGLGDSVSICFSKRSAHDLKVNQKPIKMEKLYPESGKKVAVIGSGPSGLASARNLALMGHSVKVYEKHSEPGGMMVQGIPAFRLPRDIIAKEIEQVRILGVEIVTNCEVGKDVQLKQLVNDFDAVILAAGTLRPNVLDLPGKDLKGIKHGLEFLLEVNYHEDSHAGEDAIVIGGGFTAMDCARTVKRLGAKLVKVEEDESEKDWKEHALHLSPTKANVLYRRSAGEMLVTPGEVEELGHEGIGMEFLISPVEYIGDDNGHVKAVRFIKNELGEPDASGRRRPVPVEGSEFDVPADLVLLATGQFPDTSWIDDELKPLLVAEDGWMKNYGQKTTDHAKIFMAGDFSTGARSLIDSIGHAKKTARKVDTMLMGEERLKKVAIIEDEPQGADRLIEMNDVPLIPMPTLDLEDRTLKAEVELGYTPEQGVDAAQRCYQCNIKYEIDPDVCIYCEWCVKARSRPDCIVKIKELEYGEEGEITGFKRADGSEDGTRIYINQEDCIRCNKCVEACPVDAISVQKVTRTRIRSCDGCSSGVVATGLRL